MRIAFGIIFSLLIAALCVCARFGFRSKRAIGRSVAFLVLSLIPPVTGNLIIILSPFEVLSKIGYYTYFLGMNLIMLALFHFTLVYCDYNEKGKKFLHAVLIVLSLDAASLLLNPVFRHAFSIEPIEVYGYTYFRLVPYFGQTVHRAVDYGTLAVVIVIFIVKMIRSPKIDLERYLVIFLTMIFTAIWQTFYIFSRTPMDRSMVGFAVFGLLVSYFSLRYRPMRLLDRMLAAIASEMPEALFFFDSSGKCIWANKAGTALTGVSERNYEPASDKLRELFGELGGTDDGWTGQTGLGNGENDKSYALERHTVTDDRGRTVGYFLSVRDNTAEQKTLQREIFNATHDSLTGAYNRAGYDLLISETELENTFMVLMDVDNFKTVNDTKGHDMGDRVLKRLVDTLRASFRSDDRICRVGGDEFILLVSGRDESFAKVISERIDRINSSMKEKREDCPPASVSAGIAFGASASGSKELFEQADSALYEAKRSGKSCWCTYKPE